MILPATALLLPVFAAAAPSAILDEIIVTARRREERAQDVPMSLTVLSQDQLARGRIEDVSALQFAAPNLAVTSHQTNRTAASIAMRGHFETDGAPTVDPAVGLYLDDVYIARATGANLDLFDVERVEILRGPQGTLFGRNTIGGAIQIVPNRPAPDTSALVSGGAGNYALREVAGVLNMAQSGGFSAFRLAASHGERDGFARSASLGRQIADENTDFVRAQLRIAPEDRWDLNVSFDYTRSRAGSQWVTLAATLPLAAAIPASQGNPQDSLTNYVDPFAQLLPVNRAGSTKSTVRGVSGTLTARLGHATFKSITALRSLDIDAEDSDQDGTPYDISAIIERRDRQEQFSEELQLYGHALGERMDWIGGLYYFEEDAIFTQRFPLLVPPAFDPLEAAPSGAVSNDSIAAYAQASYAITPRMRLTAGIRYNEDRRQLTSRNTRRRFGALICQLDPALLDEPDACQATLPQRRFSYTPYLFGLDFRPTSAALLYAKVSRGHRAGGYNLRGATTLDLDVFGPEQVTAYEVGAKADLLDHRLRMSLALYRSRFDDIQILQREVLPGDAQPFTVRFVRNGGEARIQGAELEATAVMGSLTIAGSLGLIDARYTRVSPKAADITLDSNFVMTPRATGSLAADLPIAVSWGAVELHGDYSWRDDVAFSYDPSSMARQRAYGLLNAGISTRLADTDLEIRLWGRNLTNTRYFVRVFQGDLLVVAIPGEPRTYGVSLTYRFAAR